ncbi:hypothetical protein DRI50_03505 [candidate division KSB1 bacterium]|nr:MAG: hypothetical protein DRI50_03505 [candidate division KSB1 bacterium]
MKIKLAHVINFMSPAGKEIGIVKLLNAMDPERFETTLIVTDKVFDHLGLNTEKTKLIVLNKKTGNDIKIFFKLYHLFKTEQYDIVHTHAWGTLVEGILPAKIAHVPVVIHGEHGTFHKDFKRRIIQKLFFNWADYLLTVSGVLADEISSAIGIKRSKFHTIFNGVDVQKFAPDAQKRAFYRRELGFTEGDFVIGTVGRPKPVKNQKLMIRALKELLPKFPTAHFVVIGDTPLDSRKENLQSLAKELNISEHVHFLGIKQDIPGYLNMFDLFVLPSLSEGCSNVLQEAMATGLPIVASNVGGNPELIQHEENGLLFDVHDLNDFVQQLTRLMEDKNLREKYGHNARRSAVDKFSLQTMISAYSEFYVHAMEQVRTGKR